MTFIDSIKRAFTPSFSNNTSYYIGYSELNSIKNIFKNDGENTAINICARIIANTVASIPINVYRDANGFKEIVKEDFRYKTLHYNPNGYTTAYTFWHTMETAKQINGNAFAIIHKFPETNSIMLEFVHPSLLFHKPYFENGFLKYCFKATEGNRIFDASEVIHFKRDSKDGIMGLNPYDVLFEEIKRTYLANKTVTNHYENDGKSTKFIKTTVTSGEIAKLEKAANKFREETGGTYYNDKNELVKGNFDKIVAFPRLPGNSEIQVIPDQINDALYLATIQNCDLKIAAFYGIPPHYLNIMQAQKNNNVETLQLDFKASTIQNILRSNRQELEMKLLTTEERDNEMSIEYNVMSIVELDHKTRLDGYSSLQKTAFMTPNEIRKIEGMNPIEGGDEHYIFDQMTTLEGINKEDASTN